MNGIDTKTRSPLDSYLEDLKQREAEGQLRRCRKLETVGEGMSVLLEGCPAVDFSSNDYLGFSQDVRLQEAAIEAIHRYGTGRSASRLISGTGPLELELEAAVAAFKRTEAALVFSSGYQANVAILQAILKPGDRVFCDKLNHASLVDGCLLSGARWTRYRHLDLNHLERKLREAPAEGRRWIVTDSVFSMDGDYPDLIALAGLAEKYGALTLVDEAHATGLYGEERSSGLCEQFGIGNRITLQMGTFSKALGGAGAYVAGSRIMMDTLINQARGFIYSTAPAPAATGAALRAVQLVQQDGSLKERLWDNVRLFETALQECGLSGRIPLPLRSPIVLVLVGDSHETLRISQALLEAGYFVQGIRPPTVPPGTARLRIGLSALHTLDQLNGLAQTLKELLAETA